jgi:iron complex outermembrane receptor protein
VKKQHLIIRMLCAAAGFYVVGAMAQQSDTDDEPAFALETIEVTATRRVTDLMDTPIAVSAIPQEQLQALGLDNIKDLSYNLPGLSIQNTDTSAPVITLRGSRYPRGWRLRPPTPGRQCLDVRPGAG